MSVIPPARRFKTSSGSGLKLDLSYILSNLAVCSGPSDSFPMNLYSNNVYELVDVLNTNHGAGNWKVINLRSEKIGYNPQYLEENGGHFQHKPYMDHHTIPFVEILKTTYEMEEYLAENPDHVVVVHCKHGKGRTGSVVVAYLMFKFGLTFSQANAVFIERRKLYKTGVSICSQVRYLEYFEFFLADVKRQAFFKALLKSNFRVTSIKLVVVNPEKMMLDNLDKLEVSLLRFTNEGRSRSGLGKLFLQNNVSQDGGTEEESDSRNKIVFQPKDPVEIKDMDLSLQLRFSVNKVTGGVCRFWMNPILEYMLHFVSKATPLNSHLANMVHQRDGQSYHKRKATKSASIQTEECEMEIPWTKMEGYKGTMKKGLNMFEGVRLCCKVEFDNSEQLVNVQKHCKSYFRSSSLFSRRSDQS